MDNRKRLRKIINLLRKEYPKPKTALAFNTPFELLAATILSAQTMDSQVNRVTEGLFRKYRSIEDFAHASLENLQKDISSVNFYKNKARNIKNSALIIVRDFGSEVPGTMKDLMALPGVARKTANIVLSTAFGVCEGIAVDTHVKRLSVRLGLTKNENPDKIEKDLMSLAPVKYWPELSFLLILHGRNTCLARSPKHDKCVLAELCPSQDL
jgi:endonuclease-3